VHDLSTILKKERGLIEKEKAYRYRFETKFIRIHFRKGEISWERK
jgi:hypothetical protein